MFTGLVQDLGRVLAATASDGGTRVRIAAACAAALAEGDSVLVNGVCLTATEPDGGEFGADVSPETLRRSALGSLAPGDRVNLELPLRPADRLGGHIVQGHVDGTATVTDVSADGFAKRLRIELPDELLPYVVERGSIAIEGVSLTIADLAGSDLEVSLIPETLERTTLGMAEPGKHLNVECDVLARYVQRQLSPLTTKEH